jgi:hypothetical protein
MPGKSYIKTGSTWKKIKRMYIKTGPAWSSIKKAYIKTGSVWKKVFDSTSSAPYSTEVPTIRLDSYTGTIKSAASISIYDPTGESRVGIKLYGRENPSSWRNGPFTSQKYQWWISSFANGQDGYMIKETTDTFYSLSSELDDYYDGMYLFFRAIYTNTANKTGTANSLPVYLRKNSPSKYTASGGWSTNGITSTLTQTGTPIKFNYSWKNEYYRSIDRYDSVIEWYRGYPANDKSNLIQSTEFIYTTNEYDDGTEYSGYDEYVPVVADVGSYIYVKTTVTNSYTKAPMYGSPIQDIYSTTNAVTARPVIVTMPSISKVDGYQTVNYLIRGNTGTYNITPTRVYWGFQYASSATAANNQWSTFQTRVYNPITFSYTYVTQGGNETSQNVNHDLYLPSSVWVNGTQISLIGKYLRLYSIADGAGSQSDTYYSEVIGPIYDYPTAAGTPSFLFGSPYNSSYAYIRAYWDPATWTLDYTLQYKSGSNWIDLGTTVTAPQYLSQDYLVPTGNQTFRVRTRNEENIYAYSAEATFNVPNSYSFAFGNYLYPNTNGQIGLDNGTTSITPSGGRLIAVYPKDLAETTTGYYSDGRYYYIQFSGHQYDQVGVGAYALRYQVRFDSLNPGYADVLICNRGSSLTLSGSIGLYNGSTQLSGLPGPYVISTNTTYRIPLDGSTGSFGHTQAQIPSANFVTHARDFGTADDGYHSILTQTNQYQTNMLSVTSATVNSSGISISFNGLNGYSYYNYEVRTGSYFGSLFSSGNSQTANPLTVGSLTGGTRYYVTITPYNSLNQSGDPYQNFFDAPSAPSAFTTSSGSKGFPSGAIQSSSQPTGNRTLNVYWNASTNGPNYEVQYEGSNDNSTWTVLQSLAGSTYKTVTYDTYTAAYYKFYRFTVRARGADLALGNAAYSDGGTSASYVYRTIDGTAPSAPTINSVVVGTGSSYNTATVNFTITSSPGSNTIDWNQYSLDGSNWSNIYTSPISLSGLSASTGYYIYMRSLNYDGLYSGTTSQYFVTNAAPVYLTAPTPSSVVKSGSDFLLYFSGGSGPYYQAWWVGTPGQPTATGYDASRSFSPIIITNLTSPSGGTTYYFSVRSVDSLTTTGTGTTTSLSISPWSTTQATYYAPITPTITTPTVTGITQTQATINWTSTNQSYAYVDGTYVGNVTSYTRTGLSASTPYSGTVTVYSTDGVTASANYSFTTASLVSYTITYSGNGNTGGSTTSTTGNGSVTLRSNGFTRTNCTFAGWNTNAAGTGTNYSAGGSYNLTSDVTLYARWTADTVTWTNPTVTFTGTSGSGSTTQRSWSWTTGSVSGATAVGYQWAISSTSSTSGFGAFSATTTARTLTVTASTPRWLKVRKVATDGLGATVVSGTNNGV